MQPPPPGFAGPPRPVNGGSEVAVLSSSVVVLICGSEFCLPDVDSPPSSPALPEDPPLRSGGGVAEGDGGGCVPQTVKSSDSRAPNGSRLQAVRPKSCPQ